MTGLSRLVVRLYGWLTALYPRAFREAFAQEMQAVFAALVADAMRGGIRALLALALRELRGLLGGLVREHAVVLRRWSGRAARFTSTLLRPGSGAVVAGRRATLVAPGALVWLQVGLVAILIVLAPLAMALTPYAHLH